MSIRPIFGVAALLGCALLACGKGQRSICVRQCEKQETCARASRQAQGEVPVGDMHSLCAELCRASEPEHEDVTARVEACLSRPCEQYDACVAAALRP